MTHGWPGSVIELLETVGPLTDPTAHGGDAEDAFHLVLPSMPGYGFSAEPAGPRLGRGRIAPAWAELMNRLGYDRYVAQGGDVGALVTDAMGRAGARGSARRPHEPALRRSLAIAISCRRSPSRNARRTRRSRRSRGTASATSWRWPRGRRRSATPCWIHPSPWRPGCSTTTRTATTRSPAPSSTASRPGNLTRDHILDDVTLYWLTGTGASAARNYWEDGRALATLRPASPLRRRPCRLRFTTFPGEIWAAPRSWVEVVYPDLAYFNEVDRGGHFAAWEEPELFSTEVRAAFRELR